MTGGSTFIGVNGLAWQHTNLWAGGKLLGTYDKIGLHFYFDDPLGTRRAQTDSAGVLEQTCTSLPYGDALSCTGGDLQAPTEHHFTGKERDVESGNDYFEARYYSSAMGRFMSPDWSAKEEPVPYAKLDDPQSLNLYAYVENNPTDRADADGHGFWDVVFGMGNAVKSNATFGLGREQGNSDFTTGQKIGDAISVVGGGIEIAYGALQATVGVGGGAATCLETLGGGCAAGAAVAIGGVAIAGHGASTAANGIKNILKSDASQAGSGSAPEPTVDSNTGAKVGRFVVDPNGNTMIEPEGGSTVSAGPGGADTHTTYPNGSNYHRLNPRGHAANPTPHGHGHLQGTGPNRAGQGPSIDTSGNVVKPNSAAAHWPIH